GTPITVDVTVNPAPTLGVNPSQQTVCSGTAPSIALSNPNAVTNTKYMWTVSQSGVSGASAQGSIGTPVNGPIAQTLSVTTANVQRTATYTITAVSPSGCVSPAQDVIVTVTPVPDVIASSQTICSGQTTNVAISNPNNVSGTSYTWTAAIQSGLPSGFSNG